MKPRPCRRPILRRAPHALALAAILSTALAESTRASSLPQAPGCSPAWLPTFAGLPGTNAGVRACVAFDDGSGEALYVGGLFSVAGGVPASRIAKWDGSRWSALGSGLSDANAIVYSLAVFDDGNGPALYAGGVFTLAGGTSRCVAKWDGTSWTSLGSGMTATTDVATVYTLSVFDDGTGPALYAGGNFTTAGGVSASYIAKWNGASWSSVGGGVSGGAYPWVYALAVHDDGSGPALHVAGEFTSAGGLAASYAAKWDGTSWSALGNGVSHPAGALAVFDDGGGDALYIGGPFTSAGGVPALRVAKWDGASWSALGSGLDGEVHALTVHDDGGGAALIAGGRFTHAGGAAANRIAKWNGASWSPLANGATGQVQQPYVYALAAFDDGNGSRLCAGGDLTLAGGVPVSYVAAWDGASWSALGGGLERAVHVLESLDLGGGPELYAGGPFKGANGVVLNRIAKWNGASWSALGSGIADVPGDYPSVDAVAVFDGGNGPELYAGGDFTSAGGVAASHIARWNGTSWSAVASGINGFEVNALIAFDDGSGEALYAGGIFWGAGGVATSNVARWNGSSWSAVGGGTLAGIGAFAVFDDGGGEALYAGGYFTSAGGGSANYVAKWNGTSWSALGSGTNDWVTALAVFDDGTGDALYAGGYFTVAGGAPAYHVARWNGASWSPLGNGLVGSASVSSLEVFDDGSGPALYAGGSFNTAGGAAGDRIAKWNGTSWSGLGSGLSEYVSTLAVHDDGTGPALFVGGYFAAGPSGDSFVAKWGCPLTPSGSPYCTAGTTTNGCVPAISGTGAASASAGSGFTLSVASLEGQRTGLFFYGLSSASSSPWSPASTSYLCVKPPQQRMGQSNSGGTSGACDGVLSTDWNAFIANHATALGQPFAGGETVWAQAWFRDPAAPKTTNLSNGLVFLVAP